MHDQTSIHILHLRRSVRCLQVAVTLLGVLLVLSWFPGNASPSFDVITCQGLRVLDAHGTMRLATAITPGESTFSLNWFDTTGQVRISGATTADGSASLSLLDTQGLSRISTETALNGSALTVWRNDANIPRLSAGTLQDGTALLKWQDPEGILRMDASVDPEGWAGLQIFDPEGHPRITATCAPGDRVTLPTVDLGK